MTIDDELNRAAEDLRRELRTVVPPPLQRSGVEHRSEIGGRLVLVMASLAVFVIGGLFVANRSPADEDLAAGGTTTGPDLTAALDDDPASTTPDTTTGPDDGASDPSSSGPAAETTVGSAEEPEIDPDGSVVLALPEGSPAWNANGSLLLMYEVGIDGGGHALYNGQSLERMRRLDIDPTDIEEVYWDPIVPEEIFYVSGDELIAQDVFTDSSTVVHRFDSCDAVTSGGVAQPVSNDGQRFGFVCERAGGAELVAFDRSTGQEVRRSIADPGTVGPVPLPDGSGYVSRSDTGFVQVYGTDLEPTDVSFTVGTDQFVLVGTADGRQLYVTPIYGQPEDAIGSVIGFDLATGEATVAIGESAGDPYPPGGTRLATSVVRSAQVIVTIVGDAENVSPTSLDGSVFVVDFDPAAPTVTPIATGQAWTAVSGVDAYWTNPYPAIDPAGNRVLFPQATEQRAVRPTIVDLDEGANP